MLTLGHPDLIFPFLDANRQNMRAMRNQITSNLQ